METPLTSVMDVVEHLVVLLKDKKRMGAEECQMLLNKLDRARELTRSSAMAAELLSNGLSSLFGDEGCECEECRRRRGDG